MKKLPIALALCALLFAMGLVACGGSPSGSSAASSSGSSAQDVAKAEYDRALALYDEGKFYSAKEAFEKSRYGDWEQRAAACLQPMPENGELFHDENLKSDKMILAFTVNETQSASDTAMYITVYTKDKQLVESLFIKGAGTIETRIPGGEYYVKDSSGTEWYGEEEQFGPNGHYESMVFNEAEGDRFLTQLEEGYKYEITINATDKSAQNVESEEGSWENRS